MSDTQSRDSGFESPLLLFKAWAFLFPPRRSSPLSCIHEYLAKECRCRRSDGNVSEWSSHSVHHD